MTVGTSATDQHAPGAQQRLFHAVPARASKIASTNRYSTLILDRSRVMNAYSPNLSSRSKR
jgi:hypothetical protein